MHRLLIAPTLWLALAASALGQSVKLPAEVQADQGTFAVVTAETECASLQWLALDPGLSMIPPALLKDSRSAVVMAGRAGRYRLLAYGARGDVPSAPAVCVVVVGEAPEPPDPPGPTPPDPPTPGPVDDLHVLILYESATANRLPTGQQAILYRPSNRTWLDNATPLGPDGRTHTWRIYDKDVDASGEAEVWRNLLKEGQGKTMPWLVLADGKGTVLHSEALPADVDRFQATVGKYKR